MGLRGAFNKLSAGRAGVSGEVWRKVLGEAGLLGPSLTPGEAHLIFSKVGRGRGLLDYCKFIRCLEWVAMRGFTPFSEIRARVVDRWGGGTSVVTGAKPLTYHPPLPSTLPLSYGPPPKAVHPFWSTTVH